MAGTPTDPPISRTPLPRGSPNTSLPSSPALVLPTVLWRTKRHGFILIINSKEHATIPWEGFRLLRALPHWAYMRTRRYAPTHGWQLLVAGFFLCMQCQRTRFETGNSARRLRTTNPRNALFFSTTFFLLYALLLCRTRTSSARRHARARRRRYLTTVRHLPAFHLPRFRAAPCTPLSLRKRAHLQLLFATAAGLPMPRGLLSHSVCHLSKHVPWWHTIQPSQYCYSFWFAFISTSLDTPLPPTTHVDTAEGVATHFTALAFLRHTTPYLALQAMPWLPRRDKGWPSFNSISSPYSLCTP